MTNPYFLLERIRNAVALTLESPDYKGAIDVIRFAFEQAGYDVHVKIKAESEPTS